MDDRPWTATPFSREIRGTKCYSIRLSGSA
jgi:hypothetical protein